ncbi:methyl-accepting chemotaxis protein [Brevibacillus fluminis]|uniref:Methyl-accepting chemotaxis protein n=1 Tax=Brevibacillus fluminis TaxID=511487 RepID=A0A3M8DID3_9BACL|nr:methyl-accepting chemotaxis protein [Brevibacillus fluminis]RNB87359.1 methyl-accepting chemotaxis protein [Brevibacillus fluminis]
MKSITTRLLLPIAVTMIVIGIINGLVLYQNMNQAVEKTISNYAMQLAERFASAIPADQYETFLQNKTESDQYWQLRDQLNALREHSGALYVYTLELSPDKQKVMNVIDGQPKDTESAAKIGQESAMPLDVITQVMNGSEVTTDIVNDPGYGDYVSALVPIKNKGGSVIGLLGVDMGAKEIDSISQKVVIGNLPAMLATGLIITGLALLFLYIIIRRRIKPLKKLQVLTKRIAQGDMSLIGELQADKGMADDEIGQLQESYRQMVVDLHAILSQVKDASTQVAASAEELAASAEQSTAMTNQIVTTTKQVAGAADEQRQSLDTAMQEFMEMSQAIQMVVSNSEETMRQADHASHASKDGMMRVDLVVKQMNEINQTVQQTGQIVEKLSERSLEIGNIVNMITQIAGQTNLLALNAAIEAARAGEQGRGFAVVADEVRKLAEQSGTFANQITQLIESIQTETKNAVQAMQSGANKVQSGLEVTSQVSESFRAIEKAISDMSEKAREASESTHHIAQSSERVTHLTEGVAEAFRESAASSEQNVRASKEQLSSMEDITQSSDALAKVAEEMQGVLTKFTL